MFINVTLLLDLWRTLILRDAIGRHLRVSQCKEDLRGLFVAVPLPSRARKTRRRKKDKKEREAWGQIQDEKKK